jgi:hypothetical protein
MRDMTVAERSGRVEPMLATGAAGEKTAAALGGSALLAIFVATIFIPGTFPAGPIVLTPYRLFLILTFLPLLRQLLQGRAGPITAIDVSMFLFCCWIGLSILLHHGPRRIIFIGTNVAEIFGAYLVGRVLVRSWADYRAFFRYILWAMVILLPFALVELLAGRRLFTDLFSHILSTKGFVRNKPRLGLTRVALSFHNPIHFGLVCSLAIANVYYIWRDRFLTSVRVTGLATFLTLTALSSSSILSVMVQMLMIAWDRIVWFLRVRWALLAVLGVFTIVTLNLALPGGLLNFLVEEVIFNRYGGEGRLTILEYGTAEILRHPVLGIGLNDWTKPFWHPDTVDNYWIVIAMRYGLPALGFLVFAIGLTLWRVMHAERLSPEAARYRTGYFIAFVGTAMIMSTVHVWEAPQVLVMTYIGAGSWFFTSAAEGWRPPEDPRARRLARQAGEVLPRAAGRAGSDALPPRAAAAARQRRAGRADAAIRHRPPAR